MLFTASALTAFGMLLNLRIQDYVLIDETERDLAPGTTSSWANRGKSILIGASDWFSATGHALMQCATAAKKPSSRPCSTSRKHCLAARLDEAGILVDGELPATACCATQRSRGRTQWSDVARVNSANWR